MRITQLYIYPVKSLRGIPLERATLTEPGLAFDRHWMVVDDIGRFVTQRQLPGMARITVRLDDEALVLEHPEASPLRLLLSRDDQPEVTTYVWEDRCLALDEGREAARWLAGVLGDWRGRGLRLVRFVPTHRRRVAPDFLRRGEEAHTVFADGFPFLVACESSLAALNQALQGKGAGPVPMSRFRPNVVIAGAASFAENGWDELHGEDRRFRLGLRKPCQRCKIVTLDQRTGEAPEPKEPLRTLVELSLLPALSGAYFGQNATLLEGEDQEIRIGEPLSAVERSAPCG